MQHPAVRRIVLLVVERMIAPATDITAYVFMFEVEISSSCVLMLKTSWRMEGDAAVCCKHIDADGKALPGASRAIINIGDDCWLWRTSARGDGLVRLGHLDYVIARDGTFQDDARQLFLQLLPGAMTTDIRIIVTAVPVANKAQLEQEMAESGDTETEIFGASLLVGKAERSAAAELVIRTAQDLEELEKRILKDFAELSVKVGRHIFTIDENRAGVLRRMEGGLSVVLLPRRWRESDARSRGPRRQCAGGRRQGAQEARELGGQQRHPAKGRDRQGLAGRRRGDARSSGRRVHCGAAAGSQEGRTECREPGASDLQPQRWFGSQPSSY